MSVAVESFDREICYCAFRNKRFLKMEIIVIYNIILTFESFKEIIIKLSKKNFRLIKKLMINMPQVIWIDIFTFN